MKSPTAMTQPAPAEVEAEIELLDRRISSVERIVEQVCALSRECSDTTGIDCLAKSKAATAQVAEAREIVAKAGVSVTSLHKVTALPGTAVAVYRVPVESRAQRLFKAVQSLQRAQEDHERAIKTRYDRQYEIVAAARAPEDAPRLQAVMPETTLDALRYVEAKHSDLLTLQREVAEMHQLFVDMAVLTELQGEALEQVETHTAAAKADVKQGTDKLREAGRAQKTHRKLLCCCVVM